jgi:hypothetical protein
VHVTVTATEAVGAYETATVSINGSGGSSLATDDINALVVRPPLSVTVHGQTITIQNHTANALGMDYSPFGNLSVTGGTCTDYIGPHTTCTLVVTLTPPDNGDGIQIQLSPFGGGGSQYFNLSF